MLYLPCTGAGFCRWLDTLAVALSKIFRLIGLGQPFESVWEETEMKLSTGEHGRIGKKSGSRVGPMAEQGMEEFT